MNYTEKYIMFVYIMKYNILLLCIFTILLYMNPTIKVFFNKPLGKCMVLLITIYLFYHSPLLGIIFIIIFITIKDSNPHTAPLSVTYATTPQTPATPLQENPVPMNSGLELLSKDEYLRSKNSNTYSMVVGSPKNCSDDGILCLYENEPKAYDTGVSSKIISNYN